MRKPWWRIAGGLPASAEAARERTFSQRRVKVIQALMALSVALGVLMLVTGNLAGLPIALAATAQLDVDDVMAARAVTARMQKRA